MKNRHMQVLGMLILTISTAAPILAQTVDAPPDNDGRRVKYGARDRRLAGGQFDSGTHQIGGRPDPYSYAPIVTSDCSGGPFPSGFSIELISRTVERTTSVVFSPPRTAQLL